MDKRMIAIFTVALMGMASLVSCNQTTDKQNEKQGTALPEPQAECVETGAIQGKEEPQEVSDPTIREILQDGANVNIDYNYIDSELDIIIVYKGAKYQLFASQLIDEARNRMEKYFAYGPEEPIKALNPSDVRPDAKLSDGIKL